MLASQQCICSETRTSYETLLSDPTAGSLKREGNPLKDLNSEAYCSYPNLPLADSFPTSLDLVEGKFPSYV